MVPWYWIPLSVFGGAAIGLLVFGLLLAAKDDLRVVGWWRGSKGTELIDTSDGRRWELFALETAGEPFRWPYQDETFERVA